MPDPRDDVASRYLFAFGEDMIVGPHDGSRSAHPIAGLSLMFLIARHDFSVRCGDGHLHLHPARCG